MTFQYPDLFEPTRWISPFSFNALIVRSIVLFPSEVISQSVCFVILGVSMIALRTAEYYGAAEPPVRCGESHLSGLTEPPVDSYSA